MAAVMAIAFLIVVLICAVCIRRHRRSKKEQERHAQVEGLRQNVGFIRYNVPT